MATVRYLVHDVEGAVAFYSKLGFELEESYGAPFAMVRRGDLVLWLSGPGSSAARPLADGSKPAPGGWCRVVIEVSDLTTAIAPLRAAGARFRGPAVSGPGGTQVIVDDPSGNAVELFERRPS